MKKHSTLLILAACSALCLLFIKLSYAQATTDTSLPMGGKVTESESDLADTIVCDAQYGPFMIESYGVGIAGPYFIRSSVNDMGSPETDDYIIGLYTSTPDESTCSNPETGTPVTAYELTTYAKSN